MTLNEISNFVASEIVNRTQFGLCVVTNTTPDFVKPKSCPFSGRVQKISAISGITFANYTNKVNGQLQKHGEVADYTPTPHWAESLRGNLWQVVYRHKTNGTLYLKVCGRKGDIDRQVRYILDGHLATKEEVAEIKSWLRERKDVQKQADAGLHGDDQVTYQLVKLENLLAVTTSKADALAMLERVQVQVTA